MVLIADPASFFLLRGFHFLSEVSISTPAVHEVAADSLKIKILMLEFLG